MADALTFLYLNQGRYKEAESMFKRALQGYGKARGPEHASTLGTVNNLGLVYRMQGRLKQAELMFERALQGYEKALVKEAVAAYPPYLDSLETMADLYSDLGRITQAKELHLAALSGCRRVFGEDHDRCEYLEDCLAGLPDRAVPTSSHFSLRAFLAETRLLVRRPLRSHGRGG